MNKSSILNLLYKNGEKLSKIYGFFKSNRSCSSNSHQRNLTIDNMNPSIKLMEYAVRGPIIIRAAEIQNELAKGVQKPFRSVTRANIGDCHAMKQRPVTFMRQVIALVTYPRLFEFPYIPEDAKEKARQILKSCEGRSVGSYSASPGLEVVRKNVALFIQKRDRVHSDWKNIILSNGATDGIRSLLRLFQNPKEKKKVGIMVPIPQYPLYSATIVENDMELVGYYLDEANKWSLNMEDMESTIEKAKKKCIPRAIVVINPGNPTGQVLSKKNIMEIIQFAYEHKLFILADEVYQFNVYDDEAEFISFKKVMNELGEPYKNMELGSFMSVSKGFMGECGLRGGYLELINMDPKVRLMYDKSITAKLCSSIIGQVAVNCIVNPPEPGDSSYQTFNKEKNRILESLKKRAHLVETTFNTFKGFECNPIQGAMYAFPRIEIPPKAIEAAMAVKQAPDVFYAFQLLENTGICIVPGTGFGQIPGTYHFRTTILPQTDELIAMLEKFKIFHAHFIKTYS